MTPWLVSGTIAAYEERACTNKKLKEKRLKKKGSARARRLR